MKLIEIQAWALRTLEVLDKGNRVEDALVKLKAEWIDSTKVARRLGGHANAARGESILWLIGADEERGIVGAGNQELANWFPAVKRLFDGIAPDLQDLKIDYKGTTIVALCFDTTRAPYVVRNAAHGKTPGDGVEWEVPWREGTRVRSATRNDLILLMSAQRKLPRFEPLYGKVSLRIDKARGGVGFWDITIRIYLVPLGGEPCVFPLHKATLAILAKGETLVDEKTLGLRAVSRQQADEEALAAVRGKAEKSLSQLPVRIAVEPVEVTSNQFLIRGPGMIDLVATGHSWPKAESSSQELRVSLGLVEGFTQSKISLSFAASECFPKDDGFTWILDVTKD